MRVVSRKSLERVYEKMWKRAARRATSPNSLAQLHILWGLQVRLSRDKGVSTLRDTHREKLTR